MRADSPRQPTRYSRVTRRALETKKEATKTRKVQPKFPPVTESGYVPNLNAMLRAEQRIEVYRQCKRQSILPYALGEAYPPRHSDL